MLKTVTNIINASQITGILPVVNGGTGVTTSTGTGSVVLSNSPSLTGTLATTGQISSTVQGASLAVGVNTGVSSSSYTNYKGTNAAGSSTSWIVGINPYATDGSGEFVDLATGLGLHLARNTGNATFDGLVTMSAYGAGAATFSASGVISSVSDETWKVKDGVPEDTDSMLKKLEPGYWYYNDEKKEIFGADRQLGFYAQNVNAAIGPEAAPIPEEGKPWGYYDRSVLAVVVMSLQKALATIETLSARITALEKK